MSKQAQDAECRALIRSFLTAGAVGSVFGLAVSNGVHRLAQIPKVLWIAAGMILVVGLHRGRR